jgi:ElaB/YqjD/DUF883 family membrane-anchored ribosome-binding protein
MDSSTTGSLSKNGQTLADQAADKVQGGIRDAQQAAKDAGANLSSKVEDLRSSAGSAISNTVARAQSIGRQGIDAVSDAAQRARDVASDTSDSVIRYTRANPVKAILIAAASGALLLSVIQLLKPSRRN